MNFEFWIWGDARQKKVVCGEIDGTQHLENLNRCSAWIGGRNSGRSRIWSGRRGELGWRMVEVGTPKAMGFRAHRTTFLCGETTNTEVGQ